MKTYNRILAYINLFIGGYYIGCEHYVYGVLSLLVGILCFIASIPDKKETK